MNYITKAAEGWTNFLSRHPWITVVSIALLVLALAAGLPKLKFNDNYRVYFAPENPDLVAWENLLDTYSRTDTLQVAIELKGGKRVFSPEVMPLIIEITDELWHLPYVSRVDSVSNFQHLQADGDELVVKDLIPKELARSESFLAERLEIARKEPHIDKLMLSEDGTVTAMYAELIIPKLGNAIEKVTEHVQDLKRRIEAENPDVRLHFGGIVMLNSAVDEVSRADIQKILPMMIGIMIVLMLAIFRSPLATVATLLSIFITIIATMGAAGHIGITLSPHSSVAPQVMLAVTVATNMHIVIAFLGRIRSGIDRRVSIIRTLEQNLLPVALSSLTTGVGFFSMLSSDIPPFRHIGVICGVGMALVFVTAIAFLPALLMVIPFRVSGHKGYGSGEWMERVGHFVIGNRRPILVLVVAALIPASYGMINLEMSDHPVRLFAKGTQLRDGADFIDEHLAGTTDIQFSLHSGKSNGLSDPEFLQKVERFKQYLLTDPMVRHVKVITDTFKRINRSMHGEDQAYYRLPESQETAAQYLLFYEMNLPFGMELTNEIDIDKSSVRLIAMVQSSASREVTDFLDRTYAWLSKEAPQFEARGVSVLVMFAYLAHRAAESMFFSAFLAIVSIGVILMLAIRSWRLGLLSMIPNLLPILIVFGIWTLFGRTVDIAASLVFSMTLGVVVDDTIHFINKFHYGREKEGLSTYDALIAAYRHAGPAMFWSTVVLVAGFSVFVTSGIQTNATLGILTALTFIVGLVLDLFVTPLLLYYVYRSKSVAPVPARAVA